MKSDVVVLSALPPCDSNVSDAITLTISNIGYVAYESQSQIALLRFDECRRMISGGPNDEAFHRHPFYELGLKFFDIQEIVDSPWISQLSAEQDRDGQNDLHSKTRHFVLALKETSVDVAADKVIAVGLYPIRRAAMDAAISAANL